MTKPKETRREAFIRLGEKRTNAVIERIRILAHCSNPYYYEYSEEDVRRIFSAIEEELKLAKGKFNQSKSGKEEFKLA